MARVRLYWRTPGVFKEGSLPRPAPAMETPKPYCPCDGHALSPSSYSNDSAPAARCAKVKQSKGACSKVSGVVLQRLCCGLHPMCPRLWCNFAEGSAKFLAISANLVFAVP